MFGSQAALYSDSFFMKFLIFILKLGLAHCSNLMANLKSPSNQALIAIALRGS